MTSVKDSPYITNFDLVPPSPPHEIQDLSPFDQTFSNPQGSPSYNGSYYNSPFSQHSELAELDFLTEFDEYEPSDYNAPNSSNSLLMFTNDSDYMSPHFRDVHDHSSPGSSNGADDRPSHSRASSVTSNHPHHSPSPQPAFQPSPRLAVADSFGNISIHTPNWNTQPLPNYSPNTHPQSLPSIQKPQSPPRLTMPHGIMDLDQQQTAVPKINAPDDDTGRPSLNIVPATPVSGGGLMRTAVPFQQTLATLTQATELTPDPQQQPQPHSSPYHFPNQELDSSPVPPNHVPTSLNNQSNAYLFPDQSVPRPRANSDNWQGSFTGPGIVNDFPNFENQNRHVQERQQLQSFSFGGNPAPSATNNFLAADSMRRTVSDSLAAPRGNAHRQSRSDDIRPPMPNYTSGPASTTPNHAQSNSIAGTNSTNMYLYPPSSHTDFIAQNQNNPQQFLQPGRRSLSPGVGHIRRASSGSRSGRGAEVWGSPASQMEGQHLTPGAHALGTRRMSPYPSPNASPRVPLNDLEQLDDLSGVGLGTMNLAVGGIGMSLGSGIGLGLGLGGVGQVLPGLEGIGEPPISAGYENDVTIAGQRGAGASAAAAAAAANSSYINDGASSHGGGHRRAESVNSDHAPIAKQNVTTGRTANASIRRRKQDANFVCTVPGCGSTFTRGFNLKGHLRSHYEQKPYKCHWPGCDKGFARQHDCKRHEQLHSNYRPFTCDGCGKNFARMDALNRHLRSEAGGECVRVVGERGGVLPGQEDDGSGGGLGMAGDGEELKPLPRRRNTGGMGMGEGAWPLPL